jgi:phenylpropionate dioxygenase-like ring-hydroxylating dioxygenase large terminal subunit/DNA-binding transcriptional regulator YbjK
MAQPQSHVSQALQDERKRLLIHATIRAIAVHGLSNLTLAKVAELAGQTAGTVSFHFSSKETLLLTTLRHLAEEFEQALARALESVGSDPRRRLQALVDVHLDAAISDPAKIAVWYAFMAEASARKDYQKICRERDSSYYETVLGLCREILGARALPDGEAVAYGLVGLIDQIWQEILFEGETYDRAAAARRCQAYLASVFSWAFDLPGVPPLARATAPAADGLVYTLPSWVYRSDEFFRLEKEHLFMPSWQIVCHTSDLPQPGSYVSFELMKERAFVIRDKDGTIRAFHNVCPHRAHSLVQSSQGRCGGRLTCPYHGWTFALDGRRVGVSAPETFRPHDRSRFGLKELECEVLFGFVFLRFRPGGRSVNEHFAPVLEEFAKYRTEEMVPEDRWAAAGGGFWEEVVDVDWKNAVENYVEDYHFPMGHKGLSALMEADYDRDSLPEGLVRLSHRMREKPLRNWSVQRYHKLLPRYAHLPVDMQRRWTYFGMFPNTYFDLFPEKMDFMQMIPLAPGKMLLRGRCYARPDEGRETRACRFLSDRINARVQDEDNLLTSEVQKGLSSSGYGRGILSDKEILVRHFQDWVRGRLPVSGLQDEPAPGTAARVNLEMMAG